MEKQNSDSESGDLKQAVSETLREDTYLVHEFGDSYWQEETVETAASSEQSPTLCEDIETTHGELNEEDIKVPVILVNIAAEVSDFEDENLVFVEDEPQEEREAETERNDHEEEPECQPDKREVSESHAATKDIVCEVIFEKKVSVEQRETVGPLEESDEDSVSALLSESSLSPLRVSSELKEIQDYKTVNEQYDTETYHRINYEKRDFVSDTSVSKGLPSLFVTEKFVLQETSEGNVEKEQSKAIKSAQEDNDMEEPLQPEKRLQTDSESSDVDLHECLEEEELSERDFAEQFMDIEGVDSETSRKEFAGDSQKYERQFEPLDDTADTQNLEVPGNLVRIEHSTMQMTPVTLTVEDELIRKEEEILESAWEVESKTEEQSIQKVEKREVAQLQKFAVISENEQTANEQSCQFFEAKNSFSMSQTESVVVSEQGGQLKISKEMEQKVEVFSRRTMLTTSHVATESTSRALDCTLESNGACISRQVGSSDELSESILDKETKDQEMEKNEKQFSEEETKVRLFKSEVLECKTAEHQAPLANPHVTVERETTLVKTLVVQSSAKEDQEEVLMREDHVTAILKDDEALLEEESAGEQFEEEIDIMRMDEALSEEEFRGEGTESVERGQSRSPKAASVEEVDKSETCDENGAFEEDRHDLEEIEIYGVDPVQEEKGEVGTVFCGLDVSLAETSVLEEEVEVATFEERNVSLEEKLELVEEDETRTESPVFEEELDVCAVPTEDDIIYVECTEEDKPVEQSALFEEELEVSAIIAQDEPFDEQYIEERKGVNRSALFEEELEISAYKTKTEVCEEREIPKRDSVDEALEAEGKHEVTMSPSHDEQTSEEHSMDGDHENLSNGNGGASSEEEEILEQSDKEENNENVEAPTPRRQPFDLSQVDLYDKEENATATRYYVELSSTESLEPTYEEVEEDETSYTETYVRQGEPLEENLEEFILVRYGDDFESSGEEDISDHREIYVIPEEENDVENNNFAQAAKAELEAAEPVPQISYEEGFENIALEEIRESPEFDIDDSDELDEEEQRQLEEYERLESFVILEEKLSQVESDDEENGGMHLEGGDESVFYSDAHSSGEDTLHEDELGETLTAGSIRQRAAFTGTKYQEDKAPQDDCCTQKKDHDSSDHQETLQACSTEMEERKAIEGFSKTQGSEKVSLDEAGPTKDTQVERLTEATTDKEYFELTCTKDEKGEQGLNSDSSGEHSVSTEGSVSSTTSLDLEGLDNFEQDCLLQHNLYRRQHRVKPLKWSEELAEGAKRWAEHLASLNSLENFEGKEVGENVTSAQGKELNGSETADLWYKEATDYNFKDPAFNAKCGRFTQVVWASSREFGVAKCVANNGTEYIVARYKPAGNILGEFKDNVKPPRGTSSRLKRPRPSVRRRSKSAACSTPAEKEKFKTDCVFSHNYYRTFHNAPPLRWSPLLAAEAQNYAERLAKTDSLTHSRQKDRGENLAYTWDFPLSARGAIEMWYDEVQDYDFEKPGFTSDTGHFTQLVWVRTEEFGMGMAVAPDGKNIVVGRYFPPGNIVGQFKENVRPREIEGIP